MQTYKTAPPLEPIEQQRSHYDFLSPIQVSMAKELGIKNISTNNTQHELLKLVKFQKQPERLHTSKYIKNLVKKHGRKVTKVILINAFEQFGHL